MSDQHPTNDIKGTLSQQLAQKTIVMALCGSVGIIKAPELARLLIRHGATVIPVMSQAATSLLHPHLMEWATGEKVIVELDGKIPHVTYCGNTPTKADLFLVYPATANSLSKIACGIDDTVVTTFATTAIGEKIPTIIVPAMHQPMYQHPAIQKNIATLESYGITVIQPRLEEGKAKIQTIETIFDCIQETLNPLPQEKWLERQRIIITGGRSCEPLDPFRLITNRSSGKMAKALAQEALRRKAQVVIISGAHSCDYPKEAQLIEVESTEQMAQAIKEAVKAPTDWLFSAAAVADWQPEQICQEKVPTSLPKWEITLVPTIKIIDQIKKWNPHLKLVAFRALNEKKESELIENAKQRLIQANADFICLNTIDKKEEGFEADFNSFFLIAKNGKIERVDHRTKRACATAIFDFILSEKE